MEEIDRALDVNLRAPIALAHALAPAMVQRGGGHLLFISSLAGKAATAGDLALQRHQVRPARLRAGPARGPAAERRRRLRGLPGLHPRRRHVRRVRRKLPPGVGTRTPEDVAKATLAAIERNRGEVDVAPLALRVGTVFGGARPGASPRGSRAASAAMTSRVRWRQGQRDKR